jgi:hypothetical protein
MLSFIFFDKSQTIFHSIEINIQAHCEQEYCEQEYSDEFCLKRYYLRRLRLLVILRLLVTEPSRLSYQIIS